MTRRRGPVGDARGARTFGTCGVRTLGARGRCLYITHALGVALGAVLGGAAVSAQQPTDAACALNVKTDGASTSYQKRDYGCEGIYVGLQSAPLNVQIVSLVRGTFDLGQDVRSMMIRTGPLAGPDSDLSLRTRVLGRARKANLNWAMDGFAKADSPMVWNLHAVVHPLALGTDQIGVTGLRERPGSLAGPVFMPVAITPTDAALPPRAPIEMVVRIPAASAVQWRLSPGDAWVIAEDGMFGATIF